MLRRSVNFRFRRKQSLKRGGNWRRIEVEVERPDTIEQSESLLALDSVLTRFENRDPDKAKLVKLRYFVGMTIKEAAESLGISVTTANRWWAYARAWLHDEMSRCSR